MNYITPLQSVQTGLSSWIQLNSVYSKTVEAIFEQQIESLAHLRSFHFLKGPQLWNGNCYLVYIMDNFLFTATHGHILLDMLHTIVWKFSSDMNKRLKQWQNSQDRPNTLCCRNWNSANIWQKRTRKCYCNWFIPLTVTFKFARLRVSILVNNCTHQYSLPSSKSDYSLNLQDFDSFKNCCKVLLNFIYIIFYWVESLFKHTGNNKIILWPYLVSKNIFFKNISPLFWELH